MELATLHLDTYKIVKLLQAKGYTKKEAEGFIEAIQEITLSGVATKQDVHDLRQDIQNLEIKYEKLDAKIGELKSHITSRIYIGQAMAVAAVIGALKLFSMI